MLCLEKPTTLFVEVVHDKKAFAPIKLKKRDTPPTTLYFYFLFYLYIVVFLGLECPSECPYSKHTWLNGGAAWNYKSGWLTWGPKS